MNLRRIIFYSDNAQLWMYVFCVPVGSFHYSWRKTLRIIAFGHFSHDGVIINFRCSKHAVRAETVRIVISIMIVPTPTTYIMIKIDKRFLAVDDRIWWIAYWRTTRGRGDRRLSNNMNTHKLRITIHRRICTGPVARLIVPGCKNDL